MRSKIILVVLIVFAFLYWRGSKAITKEKGLDCSYHIVYAVCKAKSSATPIPGLFEILKRGTKF